MAHNIKNTQLSEAINDLSSIPNISEEKIVDILQAKFLNYNIYTNVGSCNLIAVNPFKQLAQNDAQTSDDYVTLYKSASPDNPVSSTLDPHVFELANRAYFHMRRTGNDQAIFLW
jgi:chitin synthase